MSEPATEAEITRTDGSFVDPNESATEAEATAEDDGNADDESSDGE